TLIVNIIGLILIGIVILVEYNINIDFILENSLLHNFLLAMMMSFIGFIINFQILGVLIDKEFIISLKDSFILTSKFLNPKILLILIGENFFLTINILNGTFMGLIYFINFIVSLYLIDFYFEENTIIERKDIVKGIGEL
ncbi:hypothetical protein, partial [Fusobacterium sp.]|uniref:hypothetical protein n=1 Tax=Fusobacterium sp. TaxID=68766 RepID=UPI00262537AC